MKISVQFEDSDLHKVLSEMIIHPNKEEYLKLLVPIICESHRASDWFFRLHMGNKLPDIIPDGTMCYIHVNNLSYDANKEAIKNSTLCNKQGQVVCTVKEFKGYHGYSMYTVGYTNVDDNGVQKESTTSVDEKALEIIEEF
jgi:hypothetical protein